MTGAEETTAVVAGAGEHVHQARRRDAPEDALRHGTSQHAASSGARGHTPHRGPTIGSSSAASEQSTQQSWLLLLHLRGGLGQVLGVLQPIVYAVLVDVREALALLPRRLDQSLAELHALLGRQVREDLLGRLLVYVGRWVRGHLLVAEGRFLLGDRPRSLPEAVDEVLVIALRIAERIVSGIHNRTS